METILEKIVQQKKKEVEALYKTYTPVKKQRKSHSLVEALQNFTVIAEVKRASPSKGDIHLHVDVPKQVKMYEECGAGAVSVLTDGQFFKGSFHDLETARANSNIPLLCKDFIIDTIQIDRAYEAGADLILLIVAALSEEKLRELYAYVQKVGLEAIVEVHNETELEVALALNPHVIGINNRNLKTFEVDLSTTENLGKRLNEENMLWISESGIHTEEDIVRVKQAGAKGILVGEALMTAPSVGDFFQSLKVTT
ncbi:indole-3-glycerol-phosphate synthase [Bacillus pseudomycoides]|uniref:Indole-3-glycerol phosphate synthase n=1 Tax=Bacillus pseudomycoides TaxID=64104 RepID=A0AAJ1YY21_9BACI|nr:indole-3-glycerol phosphate synthase TrpC [Bacillus pseudomycoides]EEM06423.1 Indole-3-glycerol phosphate synthase [Bacillus pseudomycoides]MDR4324949.1 indole-3-glycerol phosphate synthase TrpC [Bacillus pseudomycoides]MED1535159.1 indole-3-glycerol phosphate synthase TrpC [Bacillus pseudomycoides]PEK37767.1 indole-3-glycerol-phosphate synthase [Bacillus pseudomycoides]PEK64133.1 indole-3-glycerol-phosphate synthase [Bacillus pseudomycoides]